MTDRCAPPDAVTLDPYHYVEDGVAWYVLRWSGSLQSWLINGAWMAPEKAASAFGFRYLRPARPDDAEARERLEKALRRLIDVADNAAIDCNTGVMDDAIAAAKEALNAR